MILLNLHNVEDLIFYNKEIRNLLPELKPTFDTWIFSKQNIGFRQLTKRTVVDFLNQLKEEQIEILSRHFGEKVSIDKLDYHIVLNEKMDLDDVEFLIRDDFNFGLYRDRNNLYVTYWR